VRNKNCFLLLLALCLCVWSYYPGLSGLFVFDDFGSVYKNDLLKIEHFSVEELWQASLSHSSGPLKRPISMISFAVNHVLTGMNPWWMKLTNLGIHLVNGLLVFLVLRRLFSRLSLPEQKYPLLLPSIISVVWLIHPINVTAVSYIVQRMTLLSASFVLLALYCYLKLRERKLPAWRAYVVSLSLFVFWLFGMLSKETAILLSIYIFSIEWCVYGFQLQSTREKKHLRIVWALIAAPWVVALVYIAYEPSIILAGYAYREFTLTERLLTESRIVVEYLRLIIIPDVRHMGLYHDDVIISRSLLSPVSTLLSMLFIIGLLISAIRLRKKYPLYSLGIIWFFGGHVLESSIYPLELVFLHRNYLPSIGVLLALSEVGIVLMQHYRTLVITMVCIVVLGFSICTRSLAYQWSGDSRMLLIEAINSPNSLRANYMAGQVYYSYAVASGSSTERIQYRNEADKYFRHIRELNSKDFTGELAMLEMHLRFGESASELSIAELAEGLTTAKIRPGTIHALGSIGKCLINEGCILQTGYFQSLMEAILNNSGLSAPQKANIIGNYSIYIFEHENNRVKAINIVQQAISDEPSILKLYELLIYYYGENGDIEELKRTLDNLERKDIFGEYTKYLREIKEEIDISDDFPRSPQER
jgi:hypothetical protein